MSSPGALSQERLESLDQDALVVLGITQEALAGNQLFQSLGVVTGGNTLYMGDYTTDFAGALGFSSPLSLAYAAETIAPRLREVLAD